MTDEQGTPSRQPPTRASPPPAAPSSPGHQPRRPATRASTIPAWLQSVSALIVAVLALLTALKLVGSPVSPSPSPTGAGAETAPEVRMLAFDASAEGIIGRGDYRNLRPPTDKVLFIGQSLESLESADGQWLTVVADLVPRASAAGGLETGDWSAVSQDGATGFRWYAVIASVPTGAGDPLEDLRKNGPDSELVTATSEEFTTGN